MPSLEAVDQAHGRSASQQWGIDDVAPAWAAPAPTYAVNDDHLHHFQGLMYAPPRLAVLTHLLSHVEGIVAPSARVLLYQALYRQWQGLHEADRASAAAWMDGRFTPVLSCIAQPWGTPQAIRDIAAAHLQAKSGLPTDPAFVQALYASFGITVADTAPPAWAVADVWPLLQAQVLCVNPGDADASDALQAACLTLAEREPAFMVDGMVLLFTLAMRLGDAVSATDLITECIRSEVHSLISPAQVRDWLAMDGPAPLALNDAVVQHACHSGGLATSAGLSLLHAHIAWPSARARLDHLAQALSLSCSDEPAAVPKAYEAPLWSLLLTYTQACHVDAMQLDQAHDSAWLARVQGLLQGQGLLPPAQAHLHGLLAQAAQTRGDWALAVHHAACARQAHDHAGAAQLLHALMQARGVTPAQWQSFLAQPAAGEPDWACERALWEGLLLHADHEVSWAARYMLALFYTQGSFVPTSHRKLQRLDVAKALWTDLLDSPDWCAQAQRQLGTMPFVAYHRLWRQDGGRGHLWLERPEADRLMIVFACVESHHTFASVPSLVAEAEGHHLLFVNNPELNWYADAAFDEIDALIQRQVLGRFQPDQVCCYFGSMGGYGAMRFALRHGFSAVVFNPQVDVDLWAVHRPLQRALMQSPTRRLNLQDATLAAWSRTPLYIMVGATTADRVAVDLLIERLRLARHANLIIEKFADPHHAGLIGRVSCQSPVRTVLAADARLAELTQMHAIDDPDWQTLVGASRDAFWRCLSEAQAMKVEVRIRDGLLCVKDSLACDTR